MDGLSICTNRNTLLTPKIGNLKSSLFALQQTVADGAVLLIDGRCEVIAVPNAPKFNGFAFCLPVPTICPAHRWP